MSDQDINIFQSKNYNPNSFIALDEAFDPTFDLSNLQVNAENNAETNLETVIVLDFGSQYSELIARRVRELKVYSEVLSYNVSIEKLRLLNPKGIILSGGPSSVYENGAFNGWKGCSSPFWWRRIWQS